MHYLTCTGRLLGLSRRSSAIGLEEFRDSDGRSYPTPFAAFVLSIRKGAR